MKLTRFILKTVLSAGFLGIFLLMFFGAEYARADNIQLLTPLPGLGKETSGLTDLLDALFSILITGAAVLSVLFIAIGGFEIMSRDSPFHISEGRDRIQHAIIGLLIILGSFIILNTINPDLVTFDIFKELKGVETQSGIPIEETGPEDSPAPDAEDEIIET